MTTDIAVVGIGCRFPGANNIDEFWRVLVNGESHLVDIPPERWNNEAYFSSDKDEKRKHYVKKIGFLKNYDEWDNRFFGFSDHEAAQVDPQQRYVLECTHMAFEDGGFTDIHTRGSDTGVFIGAMSGDYQGLHNFDHEDCNNFTVTGLNHAVVAARVSYVYDLRGPCMVIDTACSSALTAVHLGCQAIRNGECKMAVCGGVSSILSPSPLVAPCKARMLSPTGECQAFCDTADGYVKGEGCGVVVLKSYEQALREKNKIWGIVRTGVNQDGRAAQPLTFPSAEQQEQLLKKVYEHYSVDPTSLQYIECHGTGTPVGDPTEVNTIGKFLLESHTKLEKSDQKKGYSGHCDNRISDLDNLNHGRIRLIGSVKTNIGHLEAAAGIAGLIKVLLMMRHGMFVPSLHAKPDKSNWSKEIRFDKYGLEVSVTNGPWNVDYNFERLSCVNSFGFGGSNAHCIVIQKNNSLDITEEEQTDINSVKVVCVSAHDRTALVNTLEVLQADLDKEDSQLEDVSYTSVFHRNHFKCRTLLFGKSVAEIQKQTKDKIALLDNLEPVKCHNIVFVFCGVGTTWNGMCRGLMDTQNVFVSTVRNMDDILEKLSGLRMENTLRNALALEDPFINHIAIFYTQIALYKLWESWGVQPKAVIGQSVGEVAAAYASGALTLEDAVKIIYVRSLHLARQTGGKMMVVINCPVHIVNQLCEKYDHKVTIAVFSSPMSCTISGDTDIMEQIKIDLEETGGKNKFNILLRPLAVQCAYHSHHMDSCLENIRISLHELKGGTIKCSYFSTVTGDKLEKNDFLDGNYWVQNVRRPVKLMQAVENSIQEETTNIFLEIGPKPILRAHFKYIFENVRNNVCIPSIEANRDIQTLYTSLGKLYELGVDINWATIVSSSGHIVPIPRYSFDRKKNLYYPRKHLLLLKGILEETGAHPFVQPSGNNTEQYHAIVSPQSTPFVYEHLFLDKCLLPGATYVEIAFAIALRETALDPFQMVVTTDFVRVLTVGSNETKKISIDVNKADNCIDFVARNDGAVLCEGHISMRKESERLKLDIDDIKQRCTSISKESFYGFLNKFHFKYGETIGVVEQAWSSKTESLANLCLPDSVFVECRKTSFHPSAIDAMLQNTTFGYEIDDVKDMYLPKRLGSVSLYGPLQKEMFSYSRAITGDEGGVHFNIVLMDQNGYAIAEIRDYVCQKINNEINPSSSVSFYDINWCKAIQRQRIAATKLQPSRIEKGQVLCLCSKRVSSHLEGKLKDATFEVLSENIAEINTLISVCLETRRSKAIVYAPHQHVQTKTDGELKLMDQIKTSFLTLQFLLQSIANKQIDITVYVITEGVWTGGNFLGSELWGMVRSAMLEFPQIQMILVDMVFFDDNIKALANIVHSDETESKELLLRDGNVYHSQLTEFKTESVAKMRRQLPCDSRSCYVFKSKQAVTIEQPYCEIVAEHLGISDPINDCLLELTSVCLHMPSLYPVTTAFPDTAEIVWSDDKNEGFQILCLEGFGTINTSVSNNNNRFKTGFLFPSKAASKLAIPSECTFQLNEIPCYKPGLMTVGVILWSIFRHATSSGHVSVIVEEIACTSVQLMEFIMMQLNCNEHSFETRVNLLKESSINNSTGVVVILSKLAPKQFESIVFKYPNVRRIISIEQFMPKHMKVWLQHQKPDANCLVLDVDDVFNPLHLEGTVPILRNALRHFRATDMTEQHIDTCGKDKGKVKSIFSLPFDTLDIREQQVNQQIHLNACVKALFRKSGCYIVVGGLSGLGWEIVQIIAELGAGHIVTFSRSEPAEEKKSLISDLRKKHDCAIITMQVDILKLQDVRQAIKHIQTQIGSDNIRGIFQGAGVLCDKFLHQMSEDDVEKPLLPKVQGTWNLHLATITCPLDYFVLHSSVASIFGSAGQCNYAAGNSFQDGFVHFRRQKGLAGQSINWSALSLGMTVGRNLEDNWGNQGILLMKSEEIRNSFLNALLDNREQVMCGKFEWAKLKDSPMVYQQPAKYRTLLEKYSEYLMPANSSENQFNIDEYSKLNDHDQYELVSSVTKSILSETVILDKASLDEDMDFSALGINSMSAMSLINLVFEKTGVRVPISKLLSMKGSVKSLFSFIKESISRSKNNIEQNDEKNEWTSRLEELLQGDVTFMQKISLADWYGNKVLQINFEVQGKVIPLKAWERAIKYMCMIHSDLRRIFIIKDTQNVEARLLAENLVRVDLHEVEYSSLEHVEDRRKEVYFDLSQDMPMKFYVGIENGNTRVLAFFNMIFFDLVSLQMFIEDLLSEMEEPTSISVDSQEANKDSVAAILRKNILPEANSLAQYWQKQLRQDIQPFTLGSVLTDVENNDMSRLLLPVPTLLLKKIKSFILSKGMTLYEYVISAYMATLFERSGVEHMAVLTTMDVRSRIPQLKKFILRAVNLIPIIFSYKNVGKIGDYHKSLCETMRSAMEHNVCPFNLIHEQILSAHLQKHIARHIVICDNMNDIDNWLGYLGPTVKIGKLFHGSPHCETCLYIMYDTNKDYLTFDLRYDSKVITEQTGTNLLERVIDMLWMFVEYENENLLDITSKRVDVLGTVLSKANASTEESTTYDMKEKDIMKMFHDIPRVVQSDTFHRESIDGKRERIQLQMLEGKCINGQEDIVLVLRTEDGSTNLQISAQKISEVAVRSKNGHGNIMICTTDGWIVLKASTDKSMNWLHTFKTVVEKIKPFYKFQDELLYHL